MTGPVQGFVILDGPTILAALKATAGVYVPAPRRPLSDAELAGEIALEDLAEAMKDAREAGVSGAESDRRADVEWAERGGW